ncbi:MAG: hypothetical protein V7607_2642 [Solirubrobacteraceae bacterium]
MRSPLLIEGGRSLRRNASAEVAVRDALSQETGIREGRRGASAIAAKPRAEVEISLASLGARPVRRGRDQTLVAGLRLAWAA